MSEQTNLFEMPAVQVDATHWNIYEGSKLIGHFESDGKSYDFRSCVGPVFGGNGGSSEGSLSDMLDHVVKSLRHHHRKTSGNMMEEAGM